MKKKLVLLICLFLLFNVITVYASTAIYGYYSGYEKVKVTLNGEEVKSDRVPAFIVDKTTVIPLRAVSEKLNVIVSWNDQEKTAELIQPNVNMLFTANPVYDKDSKAYLVYSPFGKITQKQRINFSFHVFCEVDNLPYENVEIKVVLKDPNNKVVQESIAQPFNASEENSLQYINRFENIDFIMTGNYKVELLLKSKSTKDEFQKMGEKRIIVK